MTFRNSTVTGEGVVSQRAPGAQLSASTADVARNSEWRYDSPSTLWMIAAPTKHSTHRCDVYANMKRCWLTPRFTRTHAASMPPHCGCETQVQRRCGWRGRGRLVLSRTAATSRCAWRLHPSAASRFERRAQTASALSSFRSARPPGPCRNCFVFGAVAGGAHRGPRTLAGRPCAGSGAIVHL